MAADIENINTDLPGKLTEKIELSLAAGEFGTEAELMKNALSFYFENKDKAKYEVREKRNDYKVLFNSTKFQVMKTITLLESKGITPNCYSVAFVAGIAPNTASYQLSKNANIYYIPKRSKKKGHRRLVNYTLSEKGKKYMGKYQERYNQGYDLNLTRPARVADWSGFVFCPGWVEIEDTAEWIREVYGAVDVSHFFYHVEEYLPQKGMIEAYLNFITNRRLSEEGQKTARQLLKLDPFCDIMDFKSVHLEKKIKKVK